MIRLINGRGQLGTELKLQIDQKAISFPEPVLIYHTWNFLDKSEETQKKEYEKFQRFLEEDSSQTSSVIFTSTYSQQENPYNYYKQMSEAYLLNNHEKGYVIRLPTLIGKGICQRLKDGSAKPFGMMELMTIRDAAEGILSTVEEIRNKRQRLRNVQIPGEKVSAKLISELIEFGTR